MSEWYDVPLNIVWIISGIVGSIVAGLGIRSHIDKQKEIIRLKGIAEAKQGDKLEQYDNCIKKLEKRIEELRFEVKAEKLEDKKQIDEIKLYLKELKSSAQRGDEIHKELKEMLDKQQEFFIDWIQRLEDVTRDDLPRLRRKRKQSIRDIDNG